MECTVVTKEQGQGTCRSSQSGEGVVLLVTCPVNESINKVLSNFGAKIERKTPAMSTWQAGAQPRVSDNLCFARHMALCVVPVEVWVDENMLFGAKLSAGKFWDHQGSLSTTKSASNGTNGAGDIWDLEAIESIEAIEVLGTTKLSDHQITEGVFRSLFHNWVYLPIWWNCQDFAIRLGYSLTPTIQSCKTLNAMLVQLKQQMTMEVIERRNKLIFGLTISQCAPVLAPSILVAPLIPVFIGTFIGGCVVFEAYRYADLRRHNLWESYMSQLESRFPNLKTLHAGLRMDLQLFAIRTANG